MNASIMNADGSQAAGISVEVEKEDKGFRLKFSSSSLNKIIIHSTGLLDYKKCKAKQLENCIEIIPEEKEFEVLTKQPSVFGR